MGEPKVIGDLKDQLMVALEAGAAMGDPKISPRPEAYAIVPEGYKAIALEPLVEAHRLQPTRLQTVVALQSVDSFVFYVNEFKDLDSRIFIYVPEDGKNPPTVRAILDYHHDAGDAVVIRVPVPRWLEHRVGYEPRFTPEWSRFMKKDRVKMNQLELAEFIEENLTVISSPPAADMLELVQTLSGKNDISCSSINRLTNGRVKLAYEENVELRGSVSSQAGEVLFPTELVVQVPLFAYGPKYVVRCRLKYRIPNRRLEFWFEAVDVHLVIQDAVNDLVKVIQEKTGLVPLLGVAPSK